VAEAGVGPAPRLLFRQSDAQMLPDRRRRNLWVGVIDANRRQMCLEGFGAPTLRSTARRTPARRISYRRPEDKSPEPASGRRRKSWTARDSRGGSGK
jgi:hypothetical protein